MMRRDVSFQSGSLVLWESNAQDEKTERAINTAVEVAAKIERKVIVFSPQHARDKLLSFVTKRNKAKIDLDEIVVNDKAEISIEEIRDCLDQELKVSERIFCVIDQLSLVPSGKVFEKRQEETQYIIQCLENYVVDKHVAILATLQHES